MRPRVKPSASAPILVLVVFLLTLAETLIPRDYLGMDENPYLAAVVLQLLIYAVPSLFYCRLRGREFTPKLRLRLFPPSQLLYLWHALVCMTATSALLSALMYRIAPEAFSSSSAANAAAFAMGSGFFDGLYVIVAFAVLPAVTEEFLFRGVVTGEYEGLGTGIAVAVSAMMFAMAHFSAVRFPVYFAAGLILSSVLYATRSLLAPILLHAVYNGIVLFAEKYVLYIVDKQNVSMLLLMILLCAAAVLSAMLACFEAQSIYRGYAENNVPSEYAAGDRKGALSHAVEAFFTPAFLILVLLFIFVAAARR